LSNGRGIQEEGTSTCAWRKPTQKIVIRHIKNEDKPFCIKNPTNNIVIRLNILIKTEYFSLSYFIMRRKERKKHCDRCSNEFSTLYRARYLADKKWYFLCKNCVDTEKPKNDHYQYGGTWKK
jgi:hypothetical protein